MSERGNKKIDRKKKRAHAEPVVEKVPVAVEDVLSEELRMELGMADAVHGEGRHYIQRGQQSIQQTHIVVYDPMLQGRVQRISLLSFSHDSYLFHLTSLSTS